MPITANHPIERANVVVAYEDYEAGQRARRVCRQLFQLARLEPAASPDMWKFNMLNQRAMRWVATKAAATASLLVIAPHDTSPLPVGVQAWLRTVLGPLNRPQTLLALLGSAAEPASGIPAMAQELKTLAAPENVPIWWLYLKTPGGLFAEPDYAPEDLECIARCVFPANPDAASPVDLGTAYGHECV